MALVRPFRGIVYDPARVPLERVVAPPYDVISPADRIRYYRQDPHNVVRLIAGEVRPSDDAADNKYTRAAAFFRDWQREGVLRREPEPCAYVYRQRFTDPTDGFPRSRSGIIAVVRIEPFGERILPHERTHARPLQDRTSLTQAVKANLSPVFALFEDSTGSVERIVGEVQRQPPRLAMTTDGSEGHEVWRVSDRERLRALEGALEPSRLYIADGHHRYQTALRYRDLQRGEHPQSPPEAAFNYVLMLLVDATDPDLVILPTHRMLHDLEPFDPAALLERLQRAFRVTPVPGRDELLGTLHEAGSTHRIGLALPGPGLALLDLPRGHSTDPVARLDVTVLHQTVLGPELGVSEGGPEGERHLAYSRDAGFVLDEVESGRVQAAFLLRPPAVADVLAVARAGSVMPQKSTYFYPKPLSGIVFNPLDPEVRIEGA
jgi:uncharacterized protein (DUF1015 family)